MLTIVILILMLQMVVSKCVDIMCYAGMPVGMLLLIVVIVRLSMYIREDGNLTYSEPLSSDDEETKRLSYSESIRITNVSPYSPSCEGVDV